jgi:cellulose biosynthesis protein BcsQ
MTATPCLGGSSGRAISPASISCPARSIRPGTTFRCLVRRPGPPHDALRSSDLAWAALAASDYLLVPLQPEDYGAQGISAVSGAAAQVRTLVNPSLRLLGYLLTMVVPRRTIHQLYERRLRAAHGADVLTTRIPAAAEFPESVAHRLPIAIHKPRGAGAKAMRALAEEVLERIGIIGATGTTTETEAA